MKGVVLRQPEEQRGRDVKPIRPLHRRTERNGLSANCRQKQVDALRSYATKPLTLQIEVIRDQKVGPNNLLRREVERASILPRRELSHHALILAFDLGFQRNHNGGGSGLGELSERPQCCSAPKGPVAARMGSYRQIVAAQDPQRLRRLLLGDTMGGALGDNKGSQSNKLLF